MKNNQKLNCMRNEMDKILHVLQIPLIALSVGITIQ